MRRKS
jgi:hypothetical protein